MQVEYIIIRELPVNFDSNNGWSTWISQIQKQLLCVDKNAENIFKKLSTIETGKWKTSNWDKFIKGNNIASDSLKSFLKDNQYAEKSLKSYIKYLKSTTSATQIFSTATKAAAGIVKSIGATLLSGAITFAITKLIELIANYKTEAEKLDETFERTSDTLSATRSELSSVNSELVTAKKHIQELLALDSPTLTDKEELTNLQETVRLLERKRDILEGTENKEAQENAKAAEETLEVKSARKEYVIANGKVKESYVKYSPALTNGFSMSGLANPLLKTDVHEMNDTEFANRQIEQYKNARTLWLQAVSDGDDATMKLQEELMTSIAASQMSLAGEFINKLSSFQDTDGTIFEGYEDRYSQLFSLINKMDFTYSPDVFTQKVSNALDGQFESELTNLINNAKQGKLQIEDLNNVQFDGLRQALETAHISLADFYQWLGHISNVDNAKATLVEKAGPDITEEYRNYLDNLAVLDPNSLTMLVTLDFEPNPESAQNAIKKASDAASAYSSEYPVNLDSFKITDEQSKALDTFQSQISQIQTSFQNIGSMDPGDLIDLQQAFSDYDWGPFQKGTKSIKTVLQELKEKVEDTAVSAVPQMEDSIRSLGEKAFDTSKPITDLSSAISELSSKNDLLNTVKAASSSDDGNIELETLQSIVSTYPQLESAVTDYMTKVTDSKDLYTALDEAYQTDLLNYSSYIADKYGKDKWFYDMLLSNMSIDLINKSKEYQTDLEGYANYTTAKLALDELLLQSSSELSEAQQLSDDASDHLANPWFVEEKLAKAQTKHFDVNAILDNFNKSLIKTVDFKPITSTKSGGSDKQETKDYSGSIDWTDVSLKKKKNDVDDAQDFLNNTSGFQKQSAAYDDLIEKQSLLQKAYIDTAKTYNDEFESVFGQLSSSDQEKYRELIESGDSTLIEDFIDKNIPSGETGQREKVQAILEEAMAVKSKADEANRSVIQIGFEIDDSELKKAQLELDQLTSQKDLLNAQLESAATAEEKNTLLDQLNRKNDEILQKNIELAANQEEIDLLEQQAANEKDKNEQAKNQNLMDELDTQIDLLQLKKESVSDPKEKARLIEEEIKRTKELYVLKKKEAKTEEEQLLLAEQEADAIRSLEKEQSTAVTDHYQAQIDSLEAQKENVVGYRSQNAILDQILAKQKAMYAELILQAQAQGDIEEAYRLRQELLSLERRNAQEKQNNRIQDFDDRSSVLQDQISYIQKQIDVAESLTEQGTEAQYRQMIDMTQQQIDVYQAKKNYLDGVIASTEYGSDRYYELSAAISDCDEAILSAKQSQIQWNTAILELPKKQIEETIEELNALKEQQEEQKSQYDQAISAVIKVIDEETKALEEQKKAAGEAWDAKISPLQKELDLLRKTNDARKSQLSLEEAQYNLERAKNQKNLRIFKNGQWTYEADEDAIRKAQKEYDDALFNKQVQDKQNEIDALGSQKDEALSKYDEQMAALDEYKQKWSEIASIFGDMTNQAVAETLLGADFVANVLGQNLDLLNQFSQQYVELESHIETTEQQIQANQELLQSIQDIVNAYLQEQFTALEAELAIKTAVTDNQAELDAIAQINWAYQDWSAVMLATDEVMKATLGNNETVILAVQQIASEYGTTKQAVTDAVTEICALIDTYNKTFAESVNLQQTGDALVKESMKSANEEESKLLTERLGSLTTFLEKYESTLTESVNSVIREANRMRGEISSAAAGAASSLQTISSNLSSARQMASELAALANVGAGLSGVGGKPSGGGTGSGSAGSGVGGGGSNHFNEKILTMHTGMENDFVSESALSGKSLQEAFRSLSLQELRPDEIPAILQAGEAVLTEQQQRNIVNNVRSSFHLAAMIPSASPQAPEVSFHVDNMNFPNVDNTEKFVSCLTRNFEPIMKQQLYSRNFR